MEIQINEEDVKNLIDKSYLTELVANNIIKSKTNQTWQEFDDELKDALQKAVSEIADDYVKNYYEGQGIEKQISNILSKMTKEDIIKTISTKV
jgi:hypothetical protein